MGINPDTGAERVVATLPPLVVPLTAEFSGLVQGQAVVLGGSLYLLEPPYQQNGYLGYSTHETGKAPLIVTAPGTWLTYGGVSVGSSIGYGWPKSAERLTSFHLRSSARSRSSRRIDPSTAFTPRGRWSGMSRRLAT